MPFHKHHRNRIRKFCCKLHSSDKIRTLADCLENEEMIIARNLDRKTVEMGLFCGANIKVIRNNENDQNLIVVVGDSRYIISREIAQMIYVME
ncbi:MAG: FeoA family protein [Candidatus Cloacimonetes bacterium]|nr:FeoA family protein [Candidatus Cloacimonadota bacterium]